MAKKRNNDLEVVTKLVETINSIIKLSELSYERNPAKRSGGDWRTIGGLEAYRDVKTLIREITQDLDTTTNA